MKKSVKLLVNMLLVVAMLFTVCATTVFAASSGEGSGENESVSSTGGITTGWCDITYDENGVKVVLTPDKEAILGVSKQQLADIIETLVNSVKALALDKIKDGVMGNLTFTPEGSVDASGVNIDNLWSMAFDGYIALPENANRFPQKENKFETYLAFFRALVEDTTNAEISVFVDYACNLIESAVAIGVIKVEDLPTVLELEDDLPEIFENMVDEYIEDAASAYATDYIAWLTDTTGTVILDIDEDVLTFINNTVKEHVDTLVGEFVDAGFKAPADADDIDKMIADYLTDEMHSKVKEYVTKYANNQNLSQHIVDLIEYEIDGWVNELCNDWSGAENPIADIARDAIESALPTQISTYITAYFNGTLDNEDIEATITAEIKADAPAIMEAYYWAHRTEAGTKPDWFLAIDNEVRAAAEAKIREQHPMMDDSEVHEKYNGLTNQEITDYGVSLAPYISAEINKLNSFSSLKSVWDSFSATEKESVIDTVCTIIKTQKLASVIDDLWTEERHHTALKEFVDTVSEDDLNAMIKEVVGDAISNSDYKDIIESEINAHIADVDTVIASLREIFTRVKNNGSGAGEGEKSDYELLVEFVQNEIDDKLSDPTQNATIIDTAYRVYLGKTKDEVDLRVEEFIELLLVDYGVLYENLTTAPPEIDYLDLIQYLQYVEVNEHRIFADGSFSMDAVKDLARELPTPSEIMNMEDEDMKLLWDICIRTTFKDSSDQYVECNFTVEVILADNHETVRDLARIFNEHVEYSVNGQSITVKVDVPAKFSELILKAANSDKVPETLKKKVFAAFTKNADDVYALINSVTLEELLSLLDHIDFEELLDSEYLSRFESLDGLTAEQVKEKIRQYEGYYNKLVDYANSFYNNYLPSNVKDKTIINLYDGNGKFSYNGTHSVNVETVLTKISEQYGPLVASFFDVTTVSATVDLSVEFEKINKITYMIGNQVYREGFLPTDADVAYFAELTEYEGNTIIGWAEADGTQHTAMPNKDVVLYPVFEPVINVTVSIPTLSFTKVYDGAVTFIEATVTGAFPTDTVTYQWYKNDVAIANANTNRYAVVNVADSGAYYCVVTVNGTPFTTNVCTATVTKAQINLDGYVWSDADFTYDGEQKSVFLVDANGEALTFGAIYTNNTATNAGDYEASVQWNDNFEVTGTALPYSWTIKKATYDMSGVKFPNITVAVDADFEIKVIGTLPEGVTVEYTEKPTAAGTYKIVATFTGDYDNYEVIPNMTATLRMLRYVNKFEVKETDGVAYIGITVGGKGILESFKLQISDLSAIYEYFESEIFGEGKVGYAVSVYDIKFVDNGTVTGQNGQFNVKLLIPTHLRESATELKVVHISDNGRVENMNAVRDGDYMVFDTTHFSIYAIVTVGDAPVVVEPVDLTWLWVLIAVVAALLILALIIIIIVMKKRKGNTPDEPQTPETDTPDEPTPTEPSAEETVEEAVAEEPIEEETPIEEPAVEEAPAMETPTEDPAVEEAPAEEPVAEETSDAEPEKTPNIVTLLESTTVNVRYRTSFMSRLIQAEEPIQDYYTAVKNAILSYKGVKARTSWNFESFNKGRVQCAKLNVKGNALQVYLALDPNNYNANKYHFIDVSDKPKMDQVPMMLKVKSDRGLKYALELIEEMMTKLGMEFVGNPERDYHMPYETTEELARRELVKVILPAGVVLEGGENLVKTDVGALIDGVNADKTDNETASEPTVEEPVTVETPVEEPAVEEAPAEEAVAEASAVEEAPAEEAVAEESAVEESPTEPEAEQKPEKKPNTATLLESTTVNVRYRTSFMSRLIQAEEPIQDYYTAVKNALLSYKGVKARTSWNFESFNKGRVQCAKLNVKGNAFQVYLALDPNSYNINKYHFIDVSDKPKMDQVSMMLKVKSDRGLKYALELIEEMMTNLGMEFVGNPECDYHMPYETTEELARRELVKVILPAGVVLEGGENLVKTDVGALIDGVNADKTDNETASEPAVEETVTVETPIEEPAVEEPVAEFLHVDAETADEMVSDETATASIEFVERETEAKNRSGKMFEINLDTICDSFEDGDKVTLEELKAKRLINKNAGRVKILARGIMTKRLTIYADKFSLQAVKMITLAGGHADQYK